jgi:hypothetical protein
MEVDWCGKHDHEGKLEEQDVVKHEGLGVVPGFQSLSDDIRARVDGEGG